MFAQSNNSLSDISSHNEQASRSDLKRKRERHVLSCLDCRRRKVKCDRGFPVCSRCEKSGNSASCTYKSRGNTNGNGEEDEIEVELDDTAEEPAEKRMRLNGNSSHLNAIEAPQRVTAAVLPTHETTIRRLENRLADLERIVSRQTETHDAPAPKDTLAGRGRETYLFRGRGLRTQFYGASSPTSLLAHFPEVRALMKDEYSKSTVCRLKGQAQSKNGAKAKIPEAQHSGSLVELVPPYQKTDRLVRLYLDTFDQTYKILHVPSFWKEYEDFWKSPETSPARFVAVLLMVCATVYCMSNEPLTYDKEGSTARNQSVTWLMACDDWMKQQSQKHRFLEMYQVMCLRVLGVGAICLKTKAAYSGMESMFMYFKSAGIYRDPSLLGDRCSPFDGEMRRRLWATAMELELQSSIDRGAESTIAGFYADCRPPVHCNDEDLTPDMTQLPVAKPLTQYTSTSFVCIASRSLSLRIVLCAMVNNPSTLPAHEEVLRYEQQIVDAIDQIPKWSDPSSYQASALLELQLRQFLVIIHSPFARLGDSSSSRYSRMMCFEASKNIIDLHSKLIANGNYSLSLIREDVFRVVLSICHNAYLCTLKSNGFFFSGALASFPSLMEDAFKILDDRCLRVGRGMYEYWYASCACNLVQLRLDPHRASIAILAAGDRVAALYGQILAAMVESPAPEDLQEPSAPPSLGPTEASWYYSGTNTLDFSTPGMDPAAGLDLFDSSDWTLDNLWPMGAEYSMLPLGQ